jgi:hypothetical protein
LTIGRFSISSPRVYRFVVGGFLARKHDRKEQFEADEEAKGLKTCFDGFVSPVGRAPVVSPSAAAIVV